jgi:hypothetical protein
MPEIPICELTTTWFASYNARQIMEAGNKESKSGVFHVQHLISRSPAGIRIQVLFASLAANTVHWSVPWLRSCATRPTPKLLRTFDRPKHLVRVGANSAALVQQTASGTSLLYYSLQPVRCRAPSWCSRAFPPS